MTCDAIQHKLTACLLGELPPAEAARVRGHLDGCEGCRARAREIEPTLALLADALAASRPAVRTLSPAGRARVLEEGRRSVGAVAVRWIFAAHPRLALAAAFMIVAGSIWVFLRTAGPPRSLGEEAAAAPAMLDSTAIGANQVDRQRQRASARPALADAARLKKEVSNRSAAKQAAPACPAMAKEQAAVDRLDVDKGLAMRGMGVPAEAQALRKVASIPARPGSGADSATELGGSSYRETCRFIEQGSLPPPETVHADGFINAFDYAYAPPLGEGVGLYLECAPSPFADGRYLLKIGIRGRRGEQAEATEEQDEALRLVVDAGERVVFRPEAVARHRRIGEAPRPGDRASVGRDGAEAGAAGGGGSVTALYEIDLGSPPAGDSILGVVSVRYRRGETGVVEEVSREIRGGDVVHDTAAASPQWRLAVGAAAFAEALRRGPAAAGPSFDDIAAFLRPVAIELKADSRVAELVRMVEHAASLGREGGKP